MADPATPRLFFGAGSGRCGTMFLANLLNSEPGVECLHEGQFRHGEEVGEKVLEFLTLQNLAAYHQPGRALELLTKARAGMAAIGAARGARVFGDIAYNYAPFIAVIPELLSDARLIVIDRDGRDFVRSAMTDEVPDPTPVGWLDRKPADKVERFVALGRLRPGPADPLQAEWPALPALAKNAWLWAETNRLIFDGLSAWPAEQVLRVRFSELVAHAREQYGRIRSFLGLDGPMSDETEAVLARRINARGSKPLPAWDAWGEENQALFRRFAGAMMERLGYVVDE